MKADAGTAPGSEAAPSTCQPASLAANSVEGRLLVQGWAPGYKRERGEARAQVAQVRPSGTQRVPQALGAPGSSIATPKPRVVQRGAASHSRGGTAACALLTCRHARASAPWRPRWPWRPQPTAAPSCGGTSARPPPPKSARSAARRQSFAARRAGQGDGTVWVKGQQRGRVGVGTSGHAACTQAASTWLRWLSPAAAQLPPCPRPAGTPPRLSKAAADGL